MCYHWDFQLSTYIKFFVSCNTFKVDNRPASPAAVQWKWHFKVSVRKSEVTYSSVWLFSGWNINTSANLSESCNFLTRRELTREDKFWAGAFSCASLSEMNRMEMEVIPAILDKRLVNISARSRWIDQTLQSAKAPIPDAHTEREFTRNFCVWNFAIVIKSRLALHSLRTYKIALNWGQIYLWFPPRVGRRCYVILHHNR